MKFDQSLSLYQEAQQYIPGGVNSPARAFGAVGGSPIFFTRGRGAYLWDADGNSYIDYVCSWGALILGHAHPRIIAELGSAIEKGTSFGAPTEIETELAKLVRAAMPHMELTRFVSSGTEACMSALRLARAYTGKSKIIKFAGCYHGHADSFLVKAGSGALSTGMPDSAGIPDAITGLTLVATYNDIDSVREIIKGHQNEIAAVIIEPVACNMGVVLPQPHFLPQLRSLCVQNKILLIFDEVITGFRVARGGASELYGVEPDIATIGKIMGGGLPAAAYGGKKAIMQLVSPLGPVYQAGTLSGNLLAMHAGYVTLKLLERDTFYTTFESIAAYFEDALRKLLAKFCIPAQLSRVGTLMTLYFNANPVVNYETARASDSALYAKFFHAMLKRGIYLPPSQFEAWFISTAHKKADIQKTLKAAELSFQEIFS